MESSEEVDFLAGDVARPALGEESSGVSASAASLVGAEHEQDLAGDAELKVLMAQFTPLAIKDIGTIEKGVEHFFLFNHSHLALIRPDQMNYLSPKELRLLEEKRVLKLYQYVEYDDASGNLQLLNVLIRPASLKADQISKVKRGCLRGSAAALLRYIDDRDKKLLNLEMRGELGQWVSERFSRVDESGAALNPDNRAHLNRLLEKIRDLSFEAILEGLRVAGVEQTVKPARSQGGHSDPRGATEHTPGGLMEELFIGILALLGSKPAVLSDEMAQLSDLSPKAKSAMAARGPQPILHPLTPDFHVVTPVTEKLVEVAKGEIKNIHCELEWIHLLLTQLARKLLKVVLAEEDARWIKNQGVTQDQEYLRELKKHPSLTAGEWTGGANFLRAFESSIKKTRNLREIRREYLLTTVMNEVLSAITVNFEPWLFSLKEFRVPDAVSGVFQNPRELYETIVERIESNSEIFSQKERRRENEGGGEGIYIMFRHNIPRAFIENSRRRNFLHLMARDNGMEKGIYGFLREVREGVDPAPVVDEQLGLARAIRAWEEELEKERAKRERSRQGFFARLWNFFLRLFGSEPEPTRRVDDPVPVAPRAPREKEPTRRGVLVGPKERRAMVPPPVLKAAEYVARKNRGLIWLDEVVSALGSTKYTEDLVGDHLFYDDHARYVEIRPLVKVRRLFLRSDDERDPRWAEGIIDYLENVTLPRQEYDVLLSYLRQRDSED